jgi:branched-chain amino acid transport system permease protein
VSLLSTATGLSPTTKVKVGLVVAALLAGWAAPYVFSSYTVSILTLALVFALFALSVNLLAGYAGLVPLGHGGILGAAAYGVAYMAAREHAAHSVQILVGLAAALVASALFGLMAMRTKQVYFLMVTMAQGMIVWGIAYRSPDLGAENGLRGVERPEAVTAYWKYYYLTFAVVALGFLAMWVISRSPLGLSLKGLRESDSRLQMLGYNPALTKFYGFMLSGLFAAIAGVLYAYYQQFVSPTGPQFMTSGKGVLMVIVGGVGTLSGPVLGAFVIVLVENVVSSHVDRWLTLLGLVFILTIMFAPTGLVGGITQVWRRLVPGTGSAGRIAPPELDRRPTASGTATGAVDSVGARTT